ncbi:MAG: tRNA (adenosine(37)-N6)-threonylcarbamoyltransferase complex ATPase subunit type 1 TsaE [Steroidobacteraceae bacterium]
MRERRIVAPSAEETEAAGAALAAALPSLEAGAASVHLQGGLGAGKTTFARGFLRRLGVAGPLRSPTFTLLERHEAGGLVFAHVDLYRLGAPRDVEDLGLRDLARPGHVWLIEWPERGLGFLPEPDLFLQLEVLESEAHAITAFARSPLGEEWLRRAS